MAMLKDSKNEKKAGPYIITDEVWKAFKRLKNTFFSVLVLWYFDFSKLIYVKTNTLRFAIIGILS